MVNDFEKFSFEQEYLGYTFWFTENRIPFLKDKVLFICSKCNKKEIRPFKKFLDTCLKHDKVLCKKCCLSIFKEWSLYKGNPMQLKETAKSNLEKYGYEWTTQVPEFIKKKEQTFLKNYGVPHYFQSEAFQRVSSNKYKYKELNFDSSWELAYFIYNEDHNTPIIRLPQRIEYFLEEESHHYYPDFLVEGQLIEIKSSATLNNDFSLKTLLKS